MKIAVLLLMITLTSASALADGFLCEARHTGIIIRVLNHTDSRSGTRRPRIMTLSDPLQPALRYSAVFSDDHQTLSYQGRGNYLGRVDLRHSSPDLRANYIAGTRLQDLDWILLDLEFSYDPDSLALANAVPEIPGRIYYERRTHETLDEPVTCKRLRIPDADDSSF